MPSSRAGWHPTRRLATAAALAWLTVAFGQDDREKRLGAIDFFGHKGLNTEAIRAGLPVREGELFPGNRSPEDWVALITADVRKVIGQRLTDVQAVCCDDRGNYILYLGMPGASFARVEYLAAPRGKGALPSEIIKLHDRVGEATVAAIMKGHSQEDRSKGYSLFVDADVRALQLAFRERVLHQEEAVFRVLRSSSDDNQRAIAADAMGYARWSSRQVAALVQASFDPNSEVRNNSIRALGVLVEAFPELAKQVPAPRYVALLSSGNWEDRNKASYLMALLTRTRQRPLLDTLRKSPTVDSLIEMARWRNAGHRYFAATILGRMAGMEEGAEQIEAIISKVQAIGTGVRVSK